MQGRKQIRTNAQLIAIEKDKAKMFRCYKLCKILFIATMYDTIEDFTEEDAQTLMENVDLLLDSVGWGEDDLDTVAKRIEEITGVKV